MRKGDNSRNKKQKRIHVQKNKNINYRSMNNINRRRKKLTFYVLCKQNITETQTKSKCMYNRYKNACIQNITFFMASPLRQKQ
mmetsp:Transcript_45330/g.72465  ORF Transcript_45330/g.72465 Transcript_45330/m.72465 type:complete len:83 (-) Transcript_45330:76-324(-)